MASFRTMFSVIARGKSEGGPVYTKGVRVGFIGIPQEMDGTTVSLLGSFDGIRWFPVQTSKGPLSFSTRVANPVQPIQPLGSNPTVFPITEVTITEGIQMIQPVSNKVESQERKIELYLVE